MIIFINRFVNYYYVLSEYSLQHALKQINSRDFALIFLLFETGCTLKDVLSLRIKDCSPLFVAGRSQTISKELHQALLRIISNHPYRSRKDAPIFYTRESLTMTTRRAEQLIANIGKKHNLSLSARNLRHASIIHAYVSGESPDSIEKRVGLKSIQRHIYHYVLEQQKIYAKNTLQKFTQRANQGGNI